MAYSKVNYPKLEYACTDSARNIYFAGSIGNLMDFNLNSVDSIKITSTSSVKSFIAKYKNNLDFYWIRMLTGTIKYIGTSRYLVGGEEKLDITGEFNGTINLDFERPSDVTFTSEGQDLFYAKYIYLNNNISPTSILQSKNSKDILFYPNPCKGILNIKSLNDKETFLEVYDLSGKLRFSEHYSDLSEQKSIILSNLDNGLYIIKLNCNQEILIDKVMINK